jgi:crossover junction endodeoxyribonuclease RuvC
MKEERLSPVIGIDPGSRFTGYGIVDARGSQLQCLQYGCIRLSPRVPIYQRLVEFAEKLEMIISKENVAVMAIESLFTAKNVQSILKLGQVRGVALLIAARKGLQISEYSPATVKQSIVGYGRASKEQVQYMVQKTLKLQTIPKPYDISDALAIAVCHMNLSRFNRRIRGAQ